MSATERTNVDGLREMLISRVKELYKVRFPYRTEYYY
jgi:GTPase